MEQQWSRSETGVKLHLAFFFPRKMFCIITDSLHFALYMHISRPHHDILQIRALKSRISVVIK